MNFVTVSELDRDIIHNLHKIPENIDVIAGVPRSGMLAASLIALHLNRPLTDIDSLASGKIYSSGSTKNVPEKTASGMQAALVVEDSTLSGRSLMEAKKTLRQAGCSMKCIFLAVYAVGEARHNADIYFRIIPRPRAFEWNFMHYPEFLKRACVDIDGVLCMDPSPEENDDGEKYREFIRNARVKFVPTAEIGWIVTSRLEKYREDTEYWLEKHGIRYGRLCMLGLESAEERRRLGIHAEFKAEVYKNAGDAACFIESDKRQAAEINRITGKDVICVEDLSLNKADFLHSYRDIVKNGYIFAVNVLPVPVRRTLRRIKWMVKKIMGGGAECLSLIFNRKKMICDDFGAVG